MARPLSTGAAADRRFIKFVQPDGECLIWTGCKNWAGYGKFGYLRQVIGAHCYAYRRFFTVPEGYELDHLCRRPACVNVLHLEAVPHRVNVLRGESPGARVGRSGRCLQGHSLTGQNARFIKSIGRVRCRICLNATKRVPERRARERVRDTVANG